ncbi:hypothetical protein HAPAU_38480 [Halalkalicoccus paucihalophilus]|uniref:DUF305 domain-containing protein n=1 Tax=Halalkalicoccus paucihalophilus TaxID=1008153 RepID=A0A151A826_9EURY|nr:DUF305 domain-containing protein [Halalkalicoccus paucihalophilus]KYH23769.1 hypothetical protein HAPAU_38480 [Halalkalicoccus paucihalophilus]
MTQSTNRRRFLYLIGATSAIGFAGYSAADDSDEHEHGHDNNEDGRHDHDDHDHSGDHDHDEEDHHGHDTEYNGEFNHADVEFMQMMIPHHEQAIEMAELISGRTSRQELCDLGPEIIDVQEREIEMMHEWLEEADADSHDHEMDHHDMDGMMTPDEMQELRCLEGQAFDCLFVEHMIHHHESAIIMAEDALADGQADRVLEVAEDVIEVQEAEITMMKSWLTEWGC